MNIRDALEQITVIQLAMAITSPVAIAVKKAWKFLPPQNVLIPELPAWTNSWDMIREERGIGMRVQFYVVHMQLFVARMTVEDERSFDIATAFMEQVITDFDADISLAGNVTEARIRGGSPTLAGLDRGNERFVGLDLFLDLEMKEAKNFA